jgi:hypothetical protein
MIDMYRMKGPEAAQMVEQLRQDAGWSKFDLLRIVREWIPHLTGRMKNKKIHQMSLDALLAELIEMDSEGHDIRKLFWHMIDKAPFKIRLDNLDDREGCVMIDCESQILATHDQTIAGARWECPSDMTSAYAMPLDHPDLLDQLKKEGYEINDDEYSPPDPAEWGVKTEEPAACPACGGPLAPLGVLGNKQHSRCRDCGMQTDSPCSS